MLASKHHLIADLSVESWPAGLQMIQKHTKGWKMGLEADMGFLVIEAYSLPINAMFLVGSVMTHFCGSHCPLYMSIVETSSQRVMIDQAFSVPKCLRLFRISHHLHQLLKKLWRAVPGLSAENLSDTWVEELVSLQNEKSSDFERQNTRGKVLTNAPDEDKNDYIHTKLMKFETLLKASGERNLRSINLTHGGYRCHCGHRLCGFQRRATTA